MELKRRKRIVIADITSLKSDNKSFGHFFYVAEMYNSIFDKRFDVTIAGGPIYASKFSNIMRLKYNVDLKEFNKRFTKILTKLKELINARRVLKDKNNDYIIFQDYSNTMLFLSILLFGSRSNIYLIQYKNELKSQMRRRIFNLIKNKIAGVIVSKESVGAEYGTPYIVVPDYIYLGKENETDQTACTYDYGVFGIIRKGKDVVGVAKQFSQSSLKLLIAGSIQDDEMRTELYAIASTSSNITLVDKYLPENEYDQLIKSTKCIILPYVDDYYNESSSGVIFDILFRRKPVITRRYEIFDFVSSQNLGMLYEELDEIDWTSMIAEDKYRQVQNDIGTYLEQHSKKREALVSFIDNN
ncbi:hypothetical protein I8J29_26815 [Paenibacillus sp. MWE-103]|uniref:Uncharacterized protein n=1 Tax=Paenibacillus artemisiicola TaxID=1172618 RepID=A0ABS3WHT9_9BACL|nr:hypothetical protein [Paenibacillus artemisiicola]MBO7747808.1 hypothetical protein [Paenibacillus artemisiicola]